MCPIARFFDGQAIFLGNTGCIARENGTPAVDPVIEALETVQGQLASLQAQQGQDYGADLRLPIDEQPNPCDNDPTYVPKEGFSIGLPTHV